MPTPLTKYGLTKDEPQQVQIWTGSAWVAVPRLWCATLRQVVQPYGGISTAQLTYDYGRIDDGSGSGFQYFGPLGSDSSVLHGIFGVAAPAPLDILHKFIRLVVFNAETGLPEARWVGCVTSLQDENLKQPRAPHTDNDLIVSYGTQQFMVSGPEWLLSRNQLISSRVYNHELNPPQVSAERAIPFNIRSGSVATDSVDESGNKKFDNLRFTTNLQDAGQSVAWTAQDIVHYLHTYNFPNDFYNDFADPGNVEFTWNLVNESILAGFKPQLDVQGQTVLQVLNQLATPQRFLNWSIDYQGTSDIQFGEWNVRFNSASASVIDIPNGPDIPANSRTATLLFSGNVDGQVSLNGDAQNQYKQVRVTGARRGHVVTQQVQVSELLKKGWSVEDEAAYTAGAAATEPSWATLDPDDKETLNQTLRTTQYQNVFTRFVCPAGADFSAITSRHVYTPSLRWSHKLPLKDGWDYTLATPAPKAGGAEKPAYRSLFAVYRYAVVQGEERYAYHNSISHALRNDRVKPGGISSVSLAPLDDAFGVKLVPVSAQPHWQAKTESTSVADRDLKEDPQFDYGADIYVTGYFREDEFASGRYPGTPTHNLIDSADVLTIRLGDIGFHDTLHANTIVEIENGAAKTAPADVVIRSDEPLLNDIARLAYEWYGVRRFAYAVRYGQIVRDILPGMVAVNVDGATTDVVITEVTWDFQSRQTSIATAFAEPDFSLLAREAIRRG